MKVSKRFISVLLAAIMFVSVLAVAPLTTSALTATVSNSYITMKVGETTTVSAIATPGQNEAVVSYSWTSSDPFNVQILYNSTSPSCTIKAVNPTTFSSGAVLQCIIRYNKFSMVPPYITQQASYTVSCRVVVPEEPTQPPTSEPTKPTTAKPTQSTTAKKPTPQPTSENVSTPPAGSIGGSSSKPNTSATEPAESTNNKTKVDFSQSSYFYYRNKTDYWVVDITKKKGKTTFWSSNPSVLIVKKISDTKVKIKAKKGGTANLYAHNNGVTAYLKITVCNPSLLEKKKTLKKGKSFKIGIHGQVGKAKFKSSNKKVATVTKKGKVKAKKKGKATITVKTNGMKLKCKITVKK